MSKSFSSEKRHPLFENLFEPNFFRLTFWSMVRLLSYRHVSRDRSSLFVEHFSRKPEGSFDSFRADTLFFQHKRCFTFWILAFVLLKREPSGGLDNLIEPDRRIIWHHQSIVLKPIAPFKSRWIFVVVSPFWYLGVRPFEDLYFSLFKNLNIWMKWTVL